MIQPIIQPESGGCGIACAAMLSGRTYEDVKRVAGGLDIHVTDDRLWSETAPMRRLLGELEIKAVPGERPFASWDALPDRALLAIKWHLEGGVPHWHWVLFVRVNGKAAVLDPATKLRHHTRTDFGRIRPKWFIEICI